MLIPSLSPHLPDTELLAGLARLDVAPQLAQLQDKDLGPGWSPEQCARVYQEYLCFLYLTVKYPGEIIVPSWRIDMLWHNHILDTQRYAVACHVVARRFIHHQPGFGRGGPVERERLERAWGTTRTLYAQAFGVTVPGDVWDQPFRCAAPGEQG